MTPLCLNSTEKKQQHIKKNNCLKTKRYDNAYSKEYLLQNARGVSIRVTRLKYSCLKAHETT